MRIRGVTRATAVSLTCLLLVSCFPDTTKPSPSPTATPSPTSARPRFELSTYMYAVQTKGKLRVAVRDDATPLSARTSSGRYEGFEPDLARELARAIWGANEDPDGHLELVSVDDSTRVAALTSDQADVSLAGIAATDDTKKVIDLGDPYLVTGQRLLVKKANDVIKEVADVASGEQTVCAVRSSVWRDNLAKVTNNGAKILELDTMDFCLQALQTGAADAVTAGEVALLGLVAKNADLKLVGKRFAEERIGIGVKLNASGGRQGFLPFLNATLAKLVADRTWAKLYEKHLTPLTAERKQTPAE